MRPGRGAALAARLRALALPLALLALLFQADAVVRSAVMTFAGAGPAEAAAMPDCHMAGMGVATRTSPTRHGGKPNGQAAVCPYCAAASHVAIATFAAPIRAPAAVCFPGYRTVAESGPRGPPPVQPRARGPPSHPRSVPNRGPASPARPIFT